CGANRNTSWLPGPGRSSMSEARADGHTMDDVLARLRQRQRIRHAVDLLLRGLLYGAVLAAVVAGVGLATRGAWMQAAPWRVIWIVPIVAAAAAGVGFMRRVDVLPVARALDRAASGQDRFASALQLAGHHRKGRARLVIEDALTAVGGVSAQ